MKWRRASRPLWIMLTARIALIASVVALLSLLPGRAWTAASHCMDPSQAAPDYYMHADEVDLVHILGPPPAVNSLRGKSDLQAVVNAQATRTQAAMEMARSDDCLSIFSFAVVIGPGFKPENLPFTTTFFRQIFTDGEHAIGPVKKYFKRPRPFVVDDDLKPLIWQSPNGYNSSYPSGHATFAYTTAILLADMVPERAAAIFDRALAYANERVIAGVHYPTDVEAGRVCGSVIDNVLLHHHRFLADFAKARAEVRHAIGLK